MLNQGLMHLSVLLLSCFLVYYFYPEYTGVVIPLLIAITLHFSTDAMIRSMFEILPADITNTIIKYKLYITIALVLISAYYANEIYKNEFDDDSTEYIPPSESSR